MITPVSSSGERPVESVKSSVSSGGSKVIRLKEPVAGITQVVLTKPRAKHLWNFEISLEGKFSIGQILEVASSVSGVPIGVMKGLCQADCFEIVGEMSSFLDLGEEVGGEK